MDPGAGAAAADRADDGDDPAGSADGGDHPAEATVDDAADHTAHDAIHHGHDPRPGDLVDHGDHQHLHPDDATDHPGLLPATVTWASIAPGQ